MSLTLTLGMWPPVRLWRGRSKTISVSFAALALLVLACVPVAAREVTEDEQADLMEAVEIFVAAFEEGDFAKMVTLVPPKLISHFSQETNAEPKLIRRSLAAQMEAVMESVTVEQVEMDVSAISFGAFAEGAPYALVPTEIVFAEPSGSRFRMRSETLALLEDGQWYLVRMSDTQQVTLMTELYPEMRGIRFSRGSLEAME